MVGALPVAIYVLCLLAAALCTWLLLRGYWRSGARLLLWSGLCFAFLSLNSLVVILDIVVWADVDLGFLRYITSLAAVVTLLIGLIWEAK
ncbi:MAG: DUF5985 family protein [Rhizobiaceae bacterium]